MHKAFMEKVAVTDENSCWLWTGAVTEKGYGRFSFKGVAVRAHRFAAAGFRVPETSRLACHRCDVPPCVNPEHLFFATAKDNTLDMIQKGRRVPSHPTSETSRHRKLTRLDAETIRLEYAFTDTSYQRLAVAYGVTKQAIYAIVKRKVWK
jgi:hypothetical protein